MTTEPTEQEEAPKSDRATRDRSRRERGDSRGAKFVYAIVAVALLLVVLAMTLDRRYEIAYPDFLDLVRNTQYVKRGELLLQDGASGLVSVRSSDQPDQIEVFSRPRSVEVEPQFITGLADYELRNESGEVLRAADGPIEFRVNKSPESEAIAELKEAMTAANIPWKNADPESRFMEFLPLLACFLLLAGMVVYMARKMNALGSPMQFGRSRGKLYAEDEVPITFDDVAGIDEAVEEVREIVDFLQYPEKYQKLGGRIPKGVLLVGPPGTGKTLLARAIAGEADVPFFSLSGSDFVEMFVGVGAARVRDMFQQAVAKAPCIIFIDELDALGKSRAGNMPGSHDEREQTLNALLVEMDGFDANANVIVMAATNRPETLDPALLRPGRFDRNVLVDRADKYGRLEILKVHVKQVKLADDVELMQIASITPGFVGADLANLVNEAALLAARKGKTAVGQAEFNEGVERVTAGLEKKRRVMGDAERKRVAYHEAGHALVAYVLPDADPVHKVSIIPRGIAALGYTMQRPEDDRYLMTQPELEAQMQVLLAGTITEEIVFRDISTGASNDLERATSIARAMVMEYGMSRLGRINYRESGRSPFLSGGGEVTGRDYSEQTAREIDQEVKRLLDEAMVRTRTILTERRAALEALSQRLIEVEVVDSDGLRDIVEANTPPGKRTAAVANTARTGQPDKSDRAGQIIEPTPRGDITNVSTPS